jgi:hypothetical protein
MNCKHCDNKLESDVKFCSKCGKPVEAEKLERDIVDIEYFSIPLGRLALLSVLTLGIYDIFWFAKNWEAIRKAEQRKISPVGRAIFAVFYCHNLFKKILQSAKKHGYGDSYSPGILATIYIILLFVGNGLSRIENTTFGLNILWLLVAILSFIPLLFIQKAINFNNSKIVPNFNRKRKFSKGEIILTVIGVILFGLIVLGTFSSLIPDSYNSFSNGYTTTELVTETVKEVKSIITLPSKIDEVTTLVDVTAEPKAIRYHYTLSGVDTSKLSNNYLKNYLGSSICENVDIKNLLNQNINMEYSYVVDSGEQYFVSFTKTDCL